MVTVRRRSLAGQSREAVREGPSHRGTSRRTADGSGIGPLASVMAPTVDRARARAERPIDAKLGSFERDAGFLAPRLSPRPATPRISSIVTSAVTPGVNFTIFGGAVSPVSVLAVAVDEDVDRPFSEAVDGEVPVGDRSRPYRQNSSPDV